MALVARASYSSHYDEEEEAFDTSFDYNGSSGSSGVYGADALPVTEACEEGDNGIEAGKKKKRMRHNSTELLVCQTWSWSSSWRHSWPTSWPSWRSS